MLHEEVNREQMQLGAKVANLTVAEIRKAIEKLLAELRQQGKQKMPAVQHGKQS